MTDGEESATQVAPETAFDESTAHESTGAFRAARSTTGVLPRDPLTAMKHYDLAEAVDAVVIGTGAGGSPYPRPPRPRRSQGRCHRSRLISCARAVRLRRARTELPLLVRRAPHRWRQSRRLWQKQLRDRRWRFHAPLGRLCTSTQRARLQNLLGFRRRPRLASSLR